MGSDWRIILDTGVIVSGILMRDSVPGRVLSRVGSAGNLIASLETLAELESVLWRKKFDRYVSEAIRVEAIQRIFRMAEIVEVSEKVKICRDPKDDKFLALAVAGKATHLVTGDDDLLVLNPFPGCEILSPGDFLARVDV